MDLRTTVTLLPTPCAQQSGNSPEEHLRKKPGRKVVTDLAILVENGLLETGGALLPTTPNAQDGNGGGQYSSPGHQSTLPGEARLLCTPSASDGAGGKTSRSGARVDEPLLGGQAREMATAWGKYEPAIRRWESLTRPAPAPTEPNKNGNPRLAAAFSEWLMGWPQGWVTDPAIGISRNDQLRIVGNGVCPQQAAAALRYLLAVSAEAAYA
jgi:DNA (cytosine-5)-methyltransferase 1